MDISRPCQPEKLIPLLPRPGFDPSFSGHNDRRAITASGHDYALDHSAIGAGHQVACIPQNICWNSSKSAHFRLPNQCPVEHVK